MNADSEKPHRPPDIIDAALNPDTGLLEALTLTHGSDPNAGELLYGRVDGPWANEAWVNAEVTTSTMTSSKSDAATSTPGLIWIRDRGRHTESVMDQASIALLEIPLSQVVPETQRVGANLSGGTTTRFGRSSYLDMFAP